MKKMLSLVLTAALLFTIVPNVLAGAGDAVESTGSDTCIFPIAYDSVLSGNNDSTMPNNKYGDDIWGSMEYIRLTGRTRNSARAIGILKTGELTGLKDKLDSGKMVDKVELVAYLIPGSLNINTSMRFFPASSDWPEETITMLSWCDGSYQPKLVFSDTDGTAFGAFEQDAVPTDTISGSYPKVETGYELVTYDITNTFNEALKAGVTNASVFSFMMVPAETTSTYNYIWLASKDHTNSDIRPYLKITLADKPAMTVDSVTFPETEEESFTLTISNNIKSAEVKVNGETLGDDAFEISGKELVVEDIWRRLTTYKVEVDATDIYDQTMPKQTYYFTIGYDTANDGNEILCYDKSVNVSGNVLTEAKFLFTTSFDDAVASDVSIVKDYCTSDATEVQDADFVYNESDSSISLSGAVTLDADSMYTIILNAGVQDDFSNILENDLILALCYATDSPAVTSVKIMDSNFVDYVNFESEESKETVSTSDLVKAVCRINNQSDSNENILVFTASYDSEGALIDLNVSVVEAVAQTDGVYAGSPFEITDTCAEVRAFVWSAVDYTVLTKTVAASK